MLIRMPGARDYIETSRVSRIGLEDCYVKVMDGQDEMVARNFNSPEEAYAWAGEVAKIVNEANAPESSGAPPPSFADWQPTLEQITGAAGLFDADMGPMPHSINTAAQKWLQIWQRVYAAQAKR